MTTTTKLDRYLAYAEWNDGSSTERATFPSQRLALEYADGMLGLDGPAQKVYIEYVDEGIPDTFEAREAVEIGCWTTALLHRPEAPGPDDEPDTCSDHGLPLHADDETCPEVQLQLEEDRIFAETLRPLINQARKSDDYADLAGEPAPALAALKGALQRAIDAITVIVSHEHDWSDNDYCRVCGADGRA